MRFLLLFSFVFCSLWLGCESSPQRGARVVDELDLSPEEQAEIDAVLDSARIAAAEGATAARRGAGESTVFEGAAGGGVENGSDPDEPAASEAPARNWPTPGELHYRRYSNSDYGYTFEYPDNLLQWGEPIGGDRGQAFETADGTATLLVFATDDEAGALRDQYETELNRDDQDVTYEVMRPDWFVVSGYEGRYVFYQRTFRSGGGLRTFRLRHLASDREYFGPITQRLSHSFEG